MTYDGKLLALARAGLEKDREANLAEHQRRIDEAYHRVPELEQITGLPQLLKELRAR